MFFVESCFRLKGNNVLYNVSNKRCGLQASVGWGGLVTNQTKQMPCLQTHHSIINRPLKHFRLIDKPRENMPFIIIEQNYSTKKKDAFARNKAIIALGKQRNWKGILALFEEEKDQFNNVNYSTTMSQLGRIRNLRKNDPSFVAFVDTLANQIKNRGMKWMGEHGVGNITHAIAKMKLRSKGAHNIIDQVSKEETVNWLVKEGTPQAVANTAWAFATLGMKAPVLFTEIEKEAEWLVNEGNSQGAANTAWAFATLGIKAPVLFSEIERKSEWLVKEGTPQAVANTAWAYATLGTKAPKLFSEIDKHVEWLVKEGTPQAVANTAWAFATLDMKSPILFSEIERKSEWLVKEGTLQAVANTAWAFAKLGVKAPMLFSEIERKSEWLVKEGKPQDVANTAWAFATLGVKSPILFSEIERKSEWLVSEGTPQAVANTTWAFATLGMKAPMLFSEIDKHAEWLVKEGTPQAVANTAWAFATLGIESPKFFAEIDNNAEWLVKDGNPQNVANTFWAASQFNYDTPNLAFNVDKHGKWLVDSGSGQDVANVALAFATVGYEATTFFTAIEANMKKLVENVDVQALCNILYSLVVLDLGKNHQKGLSNLWKCAVKMNPDDFTNEGLQQLRLVHAFAGIEGISLLEPSPYLHDRMNSVQQDETQSRSQKEISLLLTEIGFIHEEEVSPLVDDGKTGGMLSIDMACRERKVAIECDGPSHFLVGLPKGKVLRKETGPTKAKRRFLERSGWKVINLNYQDMIKTKGNVEKIKIWLKKELEKVGIEM